jgi:hypothetical protein
MDAGIDMLNPLEVKAGMDPLALKARYGDKLAFHGGLNALLYEQPERMWAEMERIIPNMKAQGLHHRHRSLRARQREPSTCTASSWRPGAGALRLNPPFSFVLFPWGTSARRHHLKPAEQRISCDMVVFTPILSQNRIFHSCSDVIINFRCRMAWARG